MFYHVNKDAPTVDEGRAQLQAAEGSASMRNKDNGGGSRVPLGHVSAVNAGAQAFTYCQLQTETAGRCGNTWNTEAATRSSAPFGCLTARGCVLTDSLTSRPQPGRTCGRNTPAAWGTSRSSSSGYAISPGGRQQ